MFARKLRTVHHDVLTTNRHELCINRCLQQNHELYIMMCSQVSHELCISRCLQENHELYLMICLQLTFTNCASTDVSLKNSHELCITLCFKKVTLCMHSCLDLLHSLTLHLICRRHSPVIFGIRNNYTI